MRDKEYYYRFFNRKLMSEYLISVDSWHDYLHQPDNISNRTIYSYVVGSIYTDWWNEKHPNHPRDIAFFVRYHSLHVIGDKDSLLEFVKFLYKNYRKAYFGLCGVYENGKAIRTFNSVIHSDSGSHGYYPYFSSKPDYYYIYC